MFISSHPNLPPIHIFEFVFVTFVQYSIMSKMSEIVGLHEFVCHRPIISFADLVKCKDEGVFIVVACYLGVDEGVDKWIDNQLCSFVPRWGVLTLFQLSVCFCNT